MKVERARNFESGTSMKRFYEENGYVSISGLIPVDLISSIKEDLEYFFGDFDARVMELDSTEAGKKELYSLHVATSKSISFRNLLSRFSNLVKTLGNDAPVLEIGSSYLLSIPRDQRLVYDFHQESNYMKGFCDIYNFHYPIFRKSTVKNGTMSALAGSHKLGKLPFHKRKSSTDSYTDLLPLNIEEMAKEFTEVFFELDPGDCVVFHADLIHRSNYNDTDHCRPVGIARLTQSIGGDWINRSSDEL